MNNQNENNPDVLDSEVEISSLPITEYAGEFILSNTMDIVGAGYVSPNHPLEVITMDLSNTIMMLNEICSSVTIIKAIIETYLLHHKSYVDNTYELCAIMLEELDNDGYADSLSLSKVGLDGSLPNDFTETKDSRIEFINLLINMSKPMLEEYSKCGIFFGFHAMEVVLLRTI